MIFFISAYAYFSSVKARFKESTKQDVKLLSRQFFPMDVLHILDIVLKVIIPLEIRRNIDKMTTLNSLNIITSRL